MFVSIRCSHAEHQYVYLCVYLYDGWCICVCECSEEEYTKKPVGSVSRVGTHADDRGRGGREKARACSNWFAHCIVWFFLALPSFSLFLVSFFFFSSFFPFVQIPTVKLIYQFLKQVFEVGQFNPECCVISLVYINRLIGVTGVPLTQSNWKPGTDTNKHDNTCLFFFLLPSFLCVCVCFLWC